MRGSYGYVIPNESTAAPLPPEKWEELRSQEQHRRAALTPLERDREDTERAAQFQRIMRRVRP